MDDPTSSVPTGAQSPCVTSLIQLESGGEMGLSLSRNLGGGGIGLGCRGLSFPFSSCDTLSSERECLYSSGDLKGESSAMSREPEVSELPPSRSAAMMLSSSFCSSSESSKLEFASVETTLAMLIRRRRSGEGS